MKLLLYCTKQPHKLYATNEGYVLSDFELGEHYKNKEKLNGKVVAECDFEVEEHKETTIDWLCMNLREKIIFGNMCEKASIDELECYKYANGKPLYAIYIKNLHIFDEPKELSNYFTKRPYNDINKIFTDEYMKVGEWYRPITNAPQNMMYAYDFWQDRSVIGNKYFTKKILISIQPQWLCKILNGEKTIEVRKKVLREMLELI